VPVNLARLAAICVRYRLKGDGRAARIVLHALSDFLAGRYRTGAWLSANRTVSPAEGKH